MSIPQLKAPVARAAYQCVRVAFREAAGLEEMHAPGVRSRPVCPGLSVERRTRALLEDKPSALQMIPGLIVVGVGIGLVNAPLLNLVQSSLPAEESGEISGVNRAFSNLGGSLGTAIAGAVLMSVLISSFSGLLLKNPVVPQAEKRKIESKLAQDARTVSDKQVRSYLAARSFDPRVGTALYDINQKSRNKALLTALLAVGVLGVPGFLFSIFLPRVQNEEADKEAGEPAERAPELPAGQKA